MNEDVNLGEFGTNDGKVDETGDDVVTVVDDHDIYSGIANVLA